EHDFVTNLPIIQRMTNGVQTQRFGDVLAAYRQLPEGLKKDKNLLLLRLRAAQRLNEPEYQQALEDFRMAHPDDACIDFLSIDYFTLKKDFAKAFEGIDRVEQSVGGDPYLLVLRAGIQILATDLAGAATSAAKAVEQEPTLAAGHVALLRIAVLKKNHVETL